MAKKVKEEAELSPLEKALADISKIFGEGSVMMGDAIIDTERISTGSLGLDIKTGGGYGKGRIIEIFGLESSGKTTLCLEAMAQTQKNNGVVAMIDAEHAFDKKYAENLGIDTSKLILSQPSNGEEAIDILIKLVETGMVALAVVDSVSALTPKAELEGDMDSHQMGLQARMMGKAMRKLTSVVSESKAVVIFINQMRDKIGVVYGSPSTTTGGNALKFAASIRLEVKRKAGEKDKNTGEILYNDVTVKTIKNKLASPFQETSFKIVYGEGISLESEVLNYALELGLITRSGSWLSYDGSNLAQGENNTVQVLKDNPEITQLLESKIREHYGV